MKKDVREAVVTLDVLGLKPGNTGLPFNIAAEAFRFDTDAGKITGFQNWFKGQADAGILETTVTGKPWTAKYVDDAYRKGMVRAYTDTVGTGFTDPAGFIPGTRAQFLKSAFAAPEVVSKLELLALRNFSALKGISDATSQQIGEVLASGISRGSNPVQIAKEMADRIDGITKRRAMTLARTETIHAHSEAQLDQFESMGVEEVGVLAEWSTAGDDRVCPLCLPLEEQVMSVSDARGLIPRHPNCRCTWIPSVDAEGSKKTQQARLQKAVAQSVKAGAPTGTSVADAAASSRWQGRGLAKKPRTGGTKARKPAASGSTAKKLAKRSKAAKQVDEVEAALPVDRFGARQGTGGAAVNQALFDHNLFLPDIVSATGLTKERVKAHLAFLKKKGHITPHPRLPNRWRIVDPEPRPVVPVAPPVAPIVPVPKPPVIPTPKPPPTPKAGNDLFGARKGTQGAQINAELFTGVSTAEDIARKTGLSKARVNAHLTFLKKKGFIAKDKFGHWQVLKTPPGRANQ